LRAGCRSIAFIRIEKIEKKPHDMSEGGESTGHQEERTHIDYRKTGLNPAELDPLSGCPPAAVFLPGSGSFFSLANLLAVFSYNSCTMPSIVLVH
jgi:hypothetical protein